MESYSNLTPRGLEVPAASSETPKNYNKEILESFLMPKKNQKYDEGKYEYMIFVWNGKMASPLVKSLALSAAFEFESLINRAKESLLNVFKLTQHFENNILGSFLRRSNKKQQIAKRNCITAKFSSC